MTLLIIMLKLIDRESINNGGSLIVKKKKKVNHEKLDELFRYLNIPQRENESRKYIIAWMYV